MIVFMGTVFAIFMGLFGLISDYTATIGTNNYGGDVMYFLTFGLMCLTIASIAGFLSVKLYYHKQKEKKLNRYTITDEDIYYGLPTW